MFATHITHICFYIERFRIHGLIQKSL